MSMAIRWTNLSNTGWQLNAYIWFVSTIEWTQRYVKSNLFNLSTVQSVQIDCAFNVTHKRNCSIAKKCEMSLDFCDQYFDIVLIHIRFPIPGNVKRPKKMRTINYLHSHFICVVSFLFSLEHSIAMRFFPIFHQS